MNRLYTLLFAILPRRYQDKLWCKLADKHGYHSLTKMGNGTIYMSGSKMIDGRWPHIMHDVEENE